MVACITICLTFHTEGVFAFDGTFVVHSIDLVGFVLDLVGFAVPSVSPDGDFFVIPVVVVACNLHFALLVVHCYLTFAHIYHNVAQLINHSA